MTEPIKSVWYDVQAEQGAEFEDFDGWLWTSTLGDANKEYEAIRTDVAVWDVYPLVKWDFSGPDAATAVQRIFTNDAMGLAVGQVRYGAFVNADGMMLDDGTVYRLGDDHYWVMTNNPGYEGWFAEVLGGLNVSYEDRTHQMPLMSVQGPRSRELLSKLTDSDLSSLRYFHLFPEQQMVAGVPAWVLRTGFSGELGYELIPERDRAVELWKAVQDAGASIFATAGVEIARIESGMIVAGVDYQSGEGTPYDVSFDRLVALDKDVEFLGKEKLREVAANPPKRLKSLRIEASEAPEYGVEVRSGDQVVGTLTSAAVSPRFGTIGLAVLNSDVASDGTRLDVAVDGATVPATVDVLSLYDPEKRRPRA
ncbi:MAG: aminomethyltransferase family protein [Actinomycetota bacterium]